MTTIHSFCVNPVQENTYILFDETGECAIVDPGCYEAHEQRWLEQFINAKKLRPTRCLLTHAHFDHIFGCEWLFQKYGLLPEMHEGEQPVWDRGETSAARFGISFKQPTIQPLFIVENSEISFGNTVLKTLFVPGHSPASLCFYCSESEFVIAGDTLFAGAVGRTDFPGGNHAQLIEAIQTQLFTLPDATKVYAGHGRATTIGRERTSNPFFY